MTDASAPGSISPAAAAAHLLRVRDAESSFEGYVRLHHPNWIIPPFALQNLIWPLDLLERDALTLAALNERAQSSPGSPGFPSSPGFAGSALSPSITNSNIPPDQPIRKLLITMPPRHSKSAYGSVLFPAYYMLRKPNRFLMSTSYNSQLASGFGREVRELFNDPLSSQAFPDAEMRADSRSVEEWHTTDGGAAFFIGIGGTTSGRPATHLTIDDPFKSREEAESPTLRNKVWDFYTAALTTRLQPDVENILPTQVVILTRWHPDDLAGRIMETEEWEAGEWLHINLPAISERPDTTAPPVHRSALPPTSPHYASEAQLREDPSLSPTIQPVIRTALWPERFPISYLERRERLSPRDFASLYQQTPYIEGGNLIRTHWWRFFPADLRPERFSSIVISADTAFKAKSTSDYSCFGVLGLDTTGDIYLLDVIRERLEFPDLKRTAIMLNNRWRGHGLRGIYVEDKASGQSLIQELQRESGVSVIPYKVSADKVTRLTAVLPLIEGGRVFLPEAAPWLDPFMSECLAFPSTRTGDDQVDMLSLGLDVLARTPLTGAYYMPPPIPEQNGHDDLAGAPWVRWGE